MFALNDSFAIPDRGFGTYPLKGQPGYTAVRAALDAGYRLIDSAVNYENEGVVGAAVCDFLADSGTSREAVTVQTKLPGRHHDYDAALNSGFESLKRLGLDHIDVGLIHWPNPITGKYVEAWRALVELRERGVMRSIGVSNFTDEHLATIIDATGVTPAVNQIEVHPYFPQLRMRAVHAELGIVTEAWSPLGKNTSVLAEKPVTDAAANHGVTPAQAVLRWHLQGGSLALPKSATPSRQAENLDLDGFELSAHEMVAIDGLARPDGRWFGGDPNTHEEM